MGRTNSPSRATHFHAIVTHYDASLVLRIRQVVTPPIRYPHVSVANLLLEMNLDVYKARSELIRSDSCFSQALKARSPRRNGLRSMLYPKESPGVSRVGDWQIIAKTENTVFYNRTRP